MTLMHKWLGIAALPLAAVLTACETHHEIEVKPIEVNINLKGQFDVTIHDARQDLEQITGEKPQRTVSPEDIGLPAPATAPARTGAAGTLPQDGIAAPIAYLAIFNNAPAASPLASEEELKKSLAERHAKVRGMLDTQVAGEAHTGLLSARGDLSADQKATLEAENADRSALYALEAERKKVTESEVALSYYLARLGYAKKGEWYEKYNKKTSAWEWKQWGME